MKNLIIAICVILASAVPAYANDCPNQIKNLEAMAKSMPKDEATMKKVLPLIDSAKAEHAKGDHVASLKDLKEAGMLLGM